MSKEQRTSSRSGATRALEDMWESLLLSGWSSLAVVPADHGTSVELVTQALEVVTGRNAPRGFQLIDATSASVPDGEKIAREVMAAVEKGSRVVVVVDSVMRSLSGIPIIRASQEVLLVVRVGHGDPDGLNSTIGIVGADRIMGTVAIPSGG